MCIQSRRSIHIYVKICFTVLIVFLMAGCMFEISEPSVSPAAREAYETTETDVSPELSTSNIQPVTLIRTPQSFESGSTNQIGLADLDRDGDLDGDSDLDVFISYYGDGSNSVWINNQKYCSSIATSDEEASYAQKTNAFHWPDTGAFSLNSRTSPGYPRCGPGR